MGLLNGLHDGRVAGVGTAVLVGACAAGVAAERQAGKMKRTSSQLIINRGLSLLKNGVRVCRFIIKLYAECRVTAVSYHQIIRVWESSTAAQTCSTKRLHRFLCIINRTKRYMEPKSMSGVMLKLGKLVIIST